MKITGEMIEAAAKKIAGEDRGYDFYEYPHNDSDRRRYRSEARAALEAALAVAPKSAALQAIERVRALVYRRYTGSPGYENTPESVREIDAIRDGYSDRFADELLAAIEDAPAPVDHSELIAEARARASDTSGIGESGKIVMPALVVRNVASLLDRLADALEGVAK